MSTRGCVTGAQRNQANLYDQLRRSMALYCCTQYKAGQVLGISQQGFSYLLKNKALSVDQLCQLADEFDLELRLCVKG